MLYIQLGQSQELHVCLPATTSNDRSDSLVQTSVVAAKVLPGPWAGLCFPWAGGGGDWSSPGSCTGGEAVVRTPPPPTLRFCLHANTKGRVETKQAKPSFWIFSQSLTIFSSDFHRSLSIFVFSNPPWISSPYLFPLKSIKTFILQPKETCSMQ